MTGPDPQWISWPPCNTYDYEEPNEDGAYWGWDDNDIDLADFAAWSNFRSLPPLP